MVQISPVNGNQINLIDEYIKFKGLSLHLLGIEFGNVLGKPPIPSSRISQWRHATPIPHYARSYMVSEMFEHILNKYPKTADRIAALTALR